MTAQIAIWAHPWWVNLLILIPLAGYLSWRRTGLALGWNRLITAGLFAVGFGFVEAAVVVYLRAAVGVLPGYHGTLADVARLSSQFYQQAQTVSEIPSSLLVVEVLREAATMLMLVTIAWLSASRIRERWAMFLFSFAIWDATYYLWLWATIRWPLSLVDSDVLFLIPVPWLAQVWFPLLVSVLTVLAVIAGNAQAVAGRRDAPQSTLRRSRATTC